MLEEASAAAKVGSDGTAAVEAAETVVEQVAADAGPEEAC
jgi:hypothetical protein